MMQNDLLYYLIFIYVFLNVIYISFPKTKKYIFNKKKNILISNIIKLIYLLIKRNGDL